jgi:hypothetical protein
LAHGRFAISTNEEELTMSDRPSAPEVDARLIPSETGDLVLIIGPARTVDTPPLRLPGGTLIFVDPACPRLCAEIQLGDVRDDAEPLLHLLDTETVASLVHFAAQAPNSELTLRVTVGPLWAAATRLSMLGWLRDWAPENLDNELLDIERVTMLAELIPALDERGLDELDSTRSRWLLDRLVTVANQTLSLDPAAAGVLHRGAVELIRPRIGQAVLAASNAGIGDVRQQRRLAELTATFRDLDPAGGPDLMAELTADIFLERLGEWAVSESVVARREGLSPNAA